MTSQQRYTDETAQTGVIIDALRDAVFIRTYGITAQAEGAPVMLPVYKLLAMIDEVAPEALAAYVREAPPADHEETPEEAQRREAVEGAEQLGGFMGDLRTAFLRGLTR